MRLEAEIKYTGLFFTPKKSNQKLQGTLTISDGGISRLDLFGTKEEISTFLDQKTPITIDGRLNETGPAVRMFKCIVCDDNTSSGTMLPLKISFEITYLLIGKELADPNQTPSTFSKFRFCVEGLDEWINRFGIYKELGTHPNHTVTYNAPKDIKIDLEKNLSLTLKFIPNCNLASFHVTLSQKIYCEIEPTTAQTFEFFAKYFTKTITFLCLATDTPVAMESAFLYSTELKTEFTTYCQSIPFIPKKQKIRPRKFNIPYDENKFQQMMQNWILHYKSNPVPFGLYFAVRYEGYKFIDSQVLSLCHGLEALYSMIYTEKERKSLLKKMKDEKKGEISKSISSQLEKLSIKKNETTILTELIYSKIPAHIPYKTQIEYLISKVAADKEKKTLAKTITDTRNTLSHARKRKPQNEDFHTLLQELKKLYKDCFIYLIDPPPTS